MLPGDCERRKILTRTVRSWLKGIRKPTKHTRRNRPNQRVNLPRWSGYNAVLRYLTVNSLTGEPPCFGSMSSRIPSWYFASALA